MADIPKIAIENVAKAFGPNQVLDGANLSIEPGESVAIIGQSGSGKSVMLKCILGLVRADSGSIRVDGEEVIGLKGRELERMRAKFGMLFQGSALFDSLPIWRNVTFALTQGRLAEPAKMRRIAQENLERVCRSGWRWPARSRRAPKSSSSTNRPPASIRSGRT